MKCLLVACAMFTMLVAGPVRAENVVTSGETPPQKTSIDLKALWTAGEEDGEVIFGLPSGIVEDGDGNVYILDSQVSEVHVYSPDGEYLRTIGAEGEGPGEFRQAYDMYLGPNDVLGLVRIFPGRIYQFHLDGSSMSDLQLSTGAAEGFQLVYKAEANADRIVVCGARQSMSDGRQAQVNYLKSVDPTGKELVLFNEMDEATKFGDMQFDEKVYTNFKNMWSLAPNGRVAAVLSYDDYRIHVWDADGKLLHVIERPGYQPLARTEEQKARYQKMYDGLTRWNPNSTFKVSDTHRAIAGLEYRPDNSLWVLSGRGAWGQGDGAFAVYDVYDADGKFTRTVTLRGDGDPVNDGVWFGHDRLYRVTNRFAAMMAQIGGEGDEAEEGDGEGLRIVAYDLSTLELGSAR